MVEETPFSTDYAGATAGVPLACNFHVDSAQEIFMAVLPVGATVFVAVDLADYTVNDLGGGVFSVTPGLTYPASTTVKVFRWLEYTQPFYFDENGPLPAKRIEAMGDRLCMEIQQLRGEVGLDGPPITPPPPWNLAALGKLVMTWQELVDAIAAEYPVIQFGSNIVNEGSIYVPYGIKVNILPYRLVQSGTNTVEWNGVLDPSRVQVFQGFLKGEIIGSFGSGYIVPEWWGLVGIDANDGQHDLAFQCAVATWVPGVHAGVVSLDARQYWIAAPIDLRGTGVRLVGVSAAATVVFASHLFDPGVWEGFYSINSKFRVKNVTGFSGFLDPGGGQLTVVTLPGGTAECIVGDYVVIEGCDVGDYNGTWEVLGKPAADRITIGVAFVANTATGTMEPVTLDSVMETGAGTATAMIWMGVDPGGGNSYFTGIEGVGFNAQYATQKFPTKWINGISWTGFVEENSIIHDVGVSAFSGIGIGGDNAADVVVLNGVSISNFWITSSWRRYSVGIYIPKHAAVCSIRDGTIALTFEQPSSIAAVPPNPHPRACAQYCILAAGAQTVIEGVHFESAINAVHVYANDVGGTVSIRNCSLTAGIDFGMRWTVDNDRMFWAFPDPAAEEAADNLNNGSGYLYHHSCFVSIGGEAGEPRSGAFCYNMLVTVENLTPQFHLRYLLRDWAYGVHITNYDGRTPNVEGRCLNFYTRGLPYGDDDQGTYSAAGPGGAGQTELTVPSTAAMVPGNTISLYPALKANADYQGTFDIVSITDATHVVISKSPFTANSSGKTWFNQKEYVPSAPLTDRTYFTGPLF